jgi:hypothetical protein
MLWTNMSENVANQTLLIFASNIKSAAWCINLNLKSEDFDDNAACEKIRHPTFNFHPFSHKTWFKILSPFHYQKLFTSKFEFINICFKIRLKEHNMQNCQLYNNFPHMIIHLKNKIGWNWKIEKRILHGSRLGRLVYSQNIGGPPGWWTSARVLRSVYMHRILEG